MGSGHSLRDDAPAPSHIFDDAITALYTRQEVDWERLDHALAGWRPALDGIGALVHEFESGELKVPESFIQRIWRLLDVAQCEAHWHARRGDRTRPIAIATTLLGLCRLLERPAAGEARLTRYHAALTTRSMVLSSFSDPRLYIDAPADALADGRAALAATSPDLPSFRAALLGEAGQYVASMGAQLYNRRGMPFELAAGRSLMIPESAGERGLWLETAREQIHELMMAAVRGVSLDHRRGLRLMRALCTRHAPCRPGPEHGGGGWERMTMLGKAQAFVNETLHECCLLLGHAHRIFVHNLQGHAILDGMLSLEAERQRLGRWPATVMAHDPLTGGPLHYAFEDATYRLEISPESAALLAGS